METMYSWVPDVPVVQPPSATYGHARHQPTTLQASQAAPSRVAIHLPSMPGLPEDDAPPSYGVISDSPGYSPCILPQTDPPTQSMYLFKLGFVFPLLWILGSFYVSRSIRLPFLPHRPQRIPGKLEVQGDALSHVREVEIKWGKRCLGALFLLVCVGLGGGVTIWAALKMTKKQG